MTQLKKTSLRFLTGTCLAMVLLTACNNGEKKDTPADTTQKKDTTPPPVKKDTSHSDTGVLETRPVKTPD